MLKRKAFSAIEKIARDRYEEGYRVGLEKSLKEQNLSLSEDEINPVFLNDKITINIQ